MAWNMTTHNPHVACLGQATPVGASGRAVDGSLAEPPNRYRTKTAHLLPTPPSCPAPPHAPHASLPTTALPPRQHTCLLCLPGRCHATFAPTTLWHRGGWRTWLRVGRHSEIQQCNISCMGRAAIHTCWRHRCLFAHHPHALHTTPHHHTPTHPLRLVDPTPHHPHPFHTSVSVPHAAVAAGAAPRGRRSYGRWTALARCVWAGPGGTQFSASPPPLFKHSGQWMFSSSCLIHDATNCHRASGGRTRDSAYKHYAGAPSYGRRTARRRRT